MKTNLEKNLPRTMIDQHQMEQVLLNIINNAEQAILDAGRKGVITVSTKAIGQSIHVEVEDNGEGISPENLARIYDPFFTTKEIGKGTGLGLSICYGIIEEHGGEIVAASTEGEGSRFVIDLPVVAATEISTDDNSGGKISAAALAYTSGDASRRKVLVVDDEPAIIELLTDILTMDGHGVDIAKDGKSAMEKLSSTRYDNVITDINMPNMDGRELHHRIGEIDPALAANVIFITGDSVNKDTLEYLDGTGNMYLIKPFNLHDLRQTLNKVMNSNGK